MRTEISAFTFHDPTRQHSRRGRRRGAAYRRRVGGAVWGQLTLLMAFASQLVAGPLPQQSATSVADRLQSIGREGSRSPAKTAAAGARRALIICGHPGDEAHRTMYAESVRKLYQGLTTRCGFRPQNVRALFGSGPHGDDQLPGIAAGIGPSTRERIEADAAELLKLTKPDDVVWIVVLGHAHYDGRHSFLNLPGPDIREDEFGKLFKAVRCRQQLFIIATPASGFFIKHLSAKGRIVISATEADREVNETLFHLPLAEVLSNPPEQQEYDRDRDGRITVLDLYLTVVRRVMLMYKAEENIPTEHAQLDDNGDRRGTELQADYLEPDLGGRAKNGVRVRISPLADGALAATVAVDTAPIPGGTNVPPLLIPLGRVLPVPLPYADWVFVCLKDFFETF